MKVSKSSNILKFTSTQIESMTLSHITELHNDMCEVLGLKPTKRFSTKPKAVEKTLVVQEQYIAHQKSELLAKEEKSSETKPKKLSKYNMGSKLIKCESGYTPKPGSINEFISDFVAYDQPTGLELIDTIVSQFKKPRSGSNVDKSFARTSIIWMVKKGHIRISE